MNGDISIEVAEQLGHYVYLLIDPRNHAIKYVGKGSGNRPLAHLSDERDSNKVEWINELRNNKVVSGDDKCISLSFNNREQLI